MFLFTLVLGVLFLPEVDNLKCKCVSGPFGNCSEETTECSSQYDRCLVATQVTVEGDKVSERNYKGCFMSDLCLNYSVNYGVYRIAQKTSCCSGDLCNAQIESLRLAYTRLGVSLIDDYKSNGRKCFSCAEENCIKTLNCVGDENYCVKVTGNVIGVSATLKGCASELMCSDTSFSWVNQFASQFNLLTSWVNQFTGAEISCCQGNYCNSASSASPTLLLLLVPLLFSSLFS